MFQLDQRLQSDCIFIGDFQLSKLLLMNDSTYPWFILVPRLIDAAEVYQLEDVQQQQLWRESAELSRWMAQTFSFDKLNIGALGNVVRQLHLHHVGRCVTDVTWPAPVWGQHPPQPYRDAEIETIKGRADAGLIFS